VGFDDAPIAQSLLLTIAAGCTTDTPEEEDDELEDQ
jgi:hypothetical protein